MSKAIRIPITAKDKTKAAFRSVNTGMSRLQRSATSLGSALGPLAGAAAVAGIVAIGKKALESADQIQKMSKRIGVSTEALSQYQYVAKLSGTSFEVLAKGIRTGQKVLSDAADGLSTATRAFDQMGLKIADLQAMKPEVAFEAMGNAIASIENPARRTQVALNVFGRAGSDLIPVFLEGEQSIKAMREEADRLGLTLTQDMADKAAEAEDAVTRLSSAWEGFARSVSTAVAPALSGALDGMASGIESLNTKVADSRSVMDMMWDLQKTDKDFYDHLINMRGAVGGLSNAWTVAAIEAHKAGKEFSMLDVPGAPKVKPYVFGNLADKVVPAFDNSLTKDFTVAPALTASEAGRVQEELAVQMDQVQVIIDRQVAAEEWFQQFHVTAADTQAPLQDAADQMSGLNTSVNDVSTALSGDAANGAVAFGDAVVQAALSGQDAIEAMGNVAKNIFSTILSSLFKLGLSAAFPALAPVLGTVGTVASGGGYGPGFIGPIRKSVDIPGGTLLDASAKSGGPSVAAPSSGLLDASAKSGGQLVAAAAMPIKAGIEHRTGVARNVDNRGPIKIGAPIDSKGFKGFDLPAVLSSLLKIVPTVEIPKPAAAMLDKGDVTGRRVYDYIGPIQSQALAPTGTTANAAVSSDGQSGVGSAGQQSTVHVGALHVSVAGTVSDDPLSVRRLAERLQDELRTISRHHGPMAVSA